MDSPSFGWCKPLLSVAALLTVMVFNTGCSNEDFWAGAVVGAVVTDAFTNRDRHYYYYDTTPTYRYYYYRSPYYNTIEADIVPHSLENAELHFALLNTSYQNKVTHFAKRFNLDLASSTLFVTTMNQVKSGHVNALEKLGLRAEDFENIKSLGNPPEHVVNKFAYSMNISTAQSKSILSEFIKEAKQQFADISSPAWKTCMATGSWRTPQNAYCTSTSYNGCSPTTGAKMCVPIY